MNGLYCILGSALEGVPMLILQFCAYLVLTQVNVFVQGMSTTFKISVAASLISAAFNGGMSVQTVAKNARTFRQRIAVGVIAGAFTLCSSLVRCLTFTNIIVHIREYFSRHRSVRDQAKFHFSDSIPQLFMAGNITAYWLNYWLLQSPKTFSESLRDAHRLLTSLVLSYVSMILGPLYPMVSEANDRNQLGFFIFRLKLLIVSLMHLVLDLGVLFVTFWLGTLPMPYMIISLLAAAGYLVSIFGYIKFDGICGPKRSSSMSLMHGGLQPTLQTSVQGQLDLQAQASSEDRQCTEAAVPSCDAESQEDAFFSALEEQISSEMHTNANTNANPLVDLAEIHDSRPPMPSVSLKRETHTVKDMEP